MKRILFASLVCMMALSLSCFIPGANASIATGLSTTIIDSSGGGTPVDGAGIQTGTSSMAAAYDDGAGTYGLLAFSWPTLETLAGAAATFVLANTGVEDVQVLISYDYTVAAISALSFVVSDPYPFGELVSNGFLSGSESFVITLGAGQAFTLNAITLVSGIGASVAMVGNLTYEVVPIPGAVWLFGSGLTALVGLRRKFIA
jgi:hypothetical protein